MLKVKDTLRATVNLTFDGRVIKAYHGADAQARFANEVRVLKHLESRGCGFVPRLLEVDPKISVSSPAIAAAGWNTWTRNDYGICLLNSRRSECGTTIPICGM